MDISNSRGTAAYLRFKDIQAFGQTSSKSTSTIVSYFALAVDNVDAGSCRLLSPKAELSFILHRFNEVRVTMISLQIKRHLQKEQTRCINSVPCSQNS